MAKNRSRRLRKKMHIDEFQELGFSVAWRFPEGTSEEQIDKTVDDFINEVISRSARSTCHPDGQPGENAFPAHPR